MCNSVNRRISPSKTYAWLIYELIVLKIYGRIRFLIKAHHPSFVFIHVYMQTTHPSPITPILDFTVDQPVFSSPNPIVDLTKATSSTASSFNDTHDPTKHAVASPHASSSESEETMAQEIFYLVKVVDPAKKGQYKVHKLRMSVKFTSCSDIRSALSESLAEHVPEGKEYDIGYIEPSKQGVRGKTRWIFDESDIEDMYKEYQEAKKTEIIMTC